MFKSEIILESVTWAYKIYYCTASATFYEYDFAGTITDKMYKISTLYRIFKSVLKYDIEQRYLEYSINRCHIWKYSHSHIYKMRLILRPNPFEMSATQHFRIDNLINNPDFDVTSFCHHIVYIENNWRTGFGGELQINRSLNDAPRNITNLLNEAVNVAKTLYFRQINSTSPT